jgi:hypothetical protein
MDKGAGVELTNKQDKQYKQVTMFEWLNFTEVPQAREQQEDAKTRQAALKADEKLQRQLQKEEKWRLMEQMRQRLGLKLAMIIQEAT